jgi:hypothetical protein
MRSPFLPLFCFSPHFFYIFSFLEDFFQVSTKTIMRNLLDYYHYDGITMMYIAEDDRKYLTCMHESFVRGIRPVQPVAKRTRSRVAALKKHVKLMKALPELRRMQAAVRAEIYSTDYEKEIAQELVD